MRYLLQEVINSIQEDPEVSVSVKGNHYPGNKEPKEPGERKLHLLIEATNEMSLARAKQAILMVIKEQFAQIVSASAHGCWRFLNSQASMNARGGQMGRYKVM